MKDEELVSYIVKTKNILIFEILYNRYVNSVYNKTLRFGISEKDAKVFTSDFFLDLYSNLKSYNAEYKFSNWMHFKLYLLCVSFMEDDVESSIKFKEIKSTHLRIEVNDSIVYKMSPLRLKEVMRRVEPKEKAILLLHYQDNVSIEELQLLYKMDNKEIKEKLRQAKVRIVEIYNSL